MFRKLPARSFKYVLPLVISMMMSCIISGVSTFRSLGLPENFISLWMGAWAMSWVVAYPILQLVMPTARRITHLFVEKE